MDGVLTDFHQGFSDVYYSVITDKMSKEEKMKAAEAEYARQGASFWVNLDWEHGGRELWKASANLFEHIGILSSASANTVRRLEEVTEGKVEWLKKHIPELPEDQIIIVASKHQKQNYANKFSILVDDKDTTIQEWNSRGGYGILHNSSNYRKTIEDLEDIALPISLAEIVKRFSK